MTPEELMALPDVTAGLRQVENLLEGFRPQSAENAAGALFQADDDGVFTAGDVQWVTGWINGVRVRRLSWNQ